MKFKDLSKYIINEVFDMTKQYVLNIDSNGNTKYEFEHNNHTYIVESKFVNRDQYINMMFIYFIEIDSNKKEIINKNNFKHDASSIIGIIYNYICYLISYLIEKKHFNIDHIIFSSNKKDGSEIYDSRVRLYSILIDRFLNKFKIYERNKNIEEKFNTIDETFFAISKKYIDYYKNLKIRK